MNCEEVRPLLIDYSENTIDSEIRTKIEAHLETCENCKNEVHELQIILPLLAGYRPIKPDGSLRENFNAMLQSEINMLQSTKKLNWVSIRKTIKWSSPLFKIAASFVILVIGVLVGMKLKSGTEKSPSGQISELRDEVKEMKEVLMFTMLNEESASQRIKAVNYADEISNPDKKIINALIKTLNNDKNVNVRLAAAYSLAKFTNSHPVMDSLVESLSKQTEPIIQVVLINILAEKKEVKAIKPMQEIISNKNTIKEVKDIAQKYIKVLM
jgi:hypothetical protein